MSALNLWLVDRSRYECGLDHCARDRFLTYHAGPTGYGWSRKAQSIPAVTGDLIHQPLAAILREVQRTDAIPSDAFIYQAITEAIATYDKQIETRGLAVVTDPADLAFRRNEQVTLLEGLVWTWVRVALPAFHQTYRIIEVETEHLSILGCTCGLGDRIGAAEDHDSRQCRGIAWMTRGDVIAQRRDVGTYSYHDFKSVSDAGMNWEAAWPYRVQLLAGVLGAEQAYGVTIDEVYLHALIKGKRQAEWNPEEGKASGPKYQNSPLVYGWCLPANPPLSEERWAVDYNYTDGTGKRRRLTKDYVRTGLWEMSDQWWAASHSPSDYWTRWIGLEKLAGSFKLVGPIMRDDGKLQRFLRQLQGEEGRWQRILWTLHDSGLEWGDEGYQALLDTLVPQATGQACHSYFGDQCPNLRLCLRHDGWQTPELLGMIPRRPHHQPELLQAISRGLLPPDEGLEDTREE